MRAAPLKPLSLLSVPLRLPFAVVCVGAVLPLRPSVFQSLCLSVSLSVSVRPGRAHTTIRASIDLGAQARDELLGVSC